MIKDKNAKSYIYIGIIIAILLIVTVSLFFFLKKPGIPQVITSNPEKLISEAKIAYSECKLDVSKRCEAIFKNEESYCNGINGKLLEDFKKKCVTSVYLIDYYTNKLKEDRCNNIFSNKINEDKNSIEQECNKLLQAVNQIDEKLCENTDCKNKYYFILASSAKDTFTCDKISDVTMMGDCKIIISNSLEPCNYDLCKEAYDKFIIDSSKGEVTPPDPTV